MFNCGMQAINDTVKMAQFRLDILFIQPASPKYTFKNSGSICTGWI